MSTTVITRDQYFGAMAMLGLSSMRRVRRVTMQPDCVTVDYFPEAQDGNLIVSGDEIVRDTITIPIDRDSTAQLDQATPIFDELTAEASKPASQWTWISPVPA